MAARCTDRGNRAAFCVSLSPYKNAIIKALANKFAEPYYHIFAWLVS